MLESFAPGNIRSCLDVWKSYTSDAEVLEIVSGLKVEFEDPFSIPSLSRVTVSSGDQSSLIKLEVESLLNKGVIVKIDHSPGEILSPIFLTEKSDGSFRMILNLKELNKHIPKRKFKMETLSSILRLVRKNAFMVKLDIKDAYYSVPIDYDHQKFFRFQFEGQVYQYTVLPNGFSPGPRKFTKLLKPIFAKLRKDFLILLAAYIDDLLILGLSIQECFNNLKHVIHSLTELGFCINVDKSIFMPSQVMEFLGFIIDSRAMTIELTAEKKSKLISFCNEVLSSASLSIRTACTLLGKMSSSLIAVRYGRLHYRNLERCKERALNRAGFNFDASIVLDDLAKQDIRWWRDNVADAIATFAISNPDMSMSTDACSYGWGAACEGVRTGGQFSSEESLLHINVKELLACSFGLRSFFQNTSHSHILLLMDNTSAVYAVNKMGSMRSRTLDDIAKHIWKWANKRKISLTASHIPGVLNIEADEESRREDHSSEWMLNPRVFSYMLERLNFSPDIDLFASRLNAQIRPFVSYRPDPECCHVDAFSLDWGPKRFYAFPPFVCISACIQKVIHDNAMGIMIVPDWPNQLWYPELFRISVSDPIHFYDRKDLLILPSNEEAVHPIWERLSLIGVIVSGRQ